MKHLSGHSEHQQHEDEIEQMVADRLVAEAKRRHREAPPMLHGRVMEAVNAQSSTEAGGGWLSGIGWPLGLSFGAAAAGVIILLAVVMPFEFNESATVEQFVETSETPWRFAEYLETPERAEAPVHTIATGMFLAEYQKLSQDARSASEFVWATTSGWIVPE